MEIELPTEEWWYVCVDEETPKYISIGKDLDLETAKNHAENESISRCGNALDPQPGFYVLSPKGEIHGPYKAPRMGRL